MKRRCMLSRLGVTAACIGEVRWGSQEVGSLLRLDREEGRALSSSVCSVATVDSRSMIYSNAALIRDGGSGTMMRRTVFCRRITLVHFFSSNDSYFLAVASSKASCSRRSSVLRAAAEFASRWQSSTLSWTCGQVCLSGFVSMRA